MPHSLKELLAKPGIIEAPGVYDGITARVAVAEGFDVLYMTGYGTAGSHGFPDIGLLGLTEMASNAARIVDAGGVPVIADADTGYGDQANVRRTVREFERAGVSAIHLEDQVWPKKCGHMGEKQVISCVEMVDKLKAAVDSRRNEDFLIIARTDSIAVEGFDAAMERGHAYAEAGADLLFVEAPTDREQMEAVPRKLSERPHLANIAPRTPLYSSVELEAMGYKIVIHPGICLSAVLKACRDELATLKKNGLPSDPGEWRENFQEINSFLGLDEYEDGGE
ncbi:MAG TPA: isocitrate lyase/PEP mutase family protein [Candidatus Hydrogenedentes bacterium]|nr:isocitrate lyase/PEP mutase family protein [Candidatus Hydrogenedentota bacterium]